MCILTCFQYIVNLGWESNLHRIMKYLLMRIHCMWWVSVRSWTTYVIGVAGDSG